MANQTDDFDKDDLDTEPENVSRKKILLFLVPTLTVIGLAVGLHYAFKTDHKSENYSVVNNPADESGTPAGITVFYDLPEINARLKGGNKPGTAIIKINLELSNVEDAKQIEAFIPRINDAVISHTIELTEDEITGASGMYWLKEELLYRINLLIAPIKVTNLNFKNFEIQSAENN